jgi:hypothetical protein
MTEEDVAPDPLDKRCGSCARFVRVHERVDSATGEVRRAGECLLSVWPAPLYEENTCGKYVKRGTFTAQKPKPQPRARVTRTTSAGTLITERAPIIIPEELLDMDAEEFRLVLREVIREELGAGEVELGGRWQGGEVILKPGKEGTAEKRIPIDAVFHKIVAIRDRLRVLEQRVNSHPKLSDEEKVQLQQYVTQAYGSLTTFNVLFANKEDGFVGQKGDKED